jgi:glucose-1-phosphate thymidylyltransferase
MPKNTHGEANWRSRTPSRPSSPREPKSKSRREIWSFDANSSQTLLTTGAKVQVQKVQGWWKDTGKPEDLLEANQLILQELQPYNHGNVEETATLTNDVGVGEGTVIHGRTTIRGPVVIGEHCDIGPNTYIGPYTSIGDHATIRNTEIENTIIMSGALIDCGKRITDSLIGKNVEITDSNQFVPKGHKLILGDASKVTL